MKRLLVLVLLLLLAAVALLVSQAQRLFGNAGALAGAALAALADAHSPIASLLSREISRQ